ncbi:MAG: tetraacyldisaccharide 4'-kinase [Muribaculaceae bacterium]|nr:tetraacyldisaccharide 4'-kinase [Muribaculaceae bacterium]
MKPYVDKFLTYALVPAKWLYGMGVWFHNWLYDSNIRTQRSFDVPVISVGNLTVGGTGKTPHVEYIIEHLSDRYNIAVLSRGYKRKTSGFVLATQFSTPEQIGDEPYQINRKFGDKIKVAVTKNRKRGIEKIMKLFPETDLIVLDDAYQYRAIRPLISILLLDSHRPIDKDDLLPLGRLREPQHATERADMIIVTKCPERMSPFDFRAYSKTFNFLSFQKLFFSSIFFRQLMPVFPGNAFPMNMESLTEEDSVLLISGIAHPRSFVNYFRDFPCKVKVMRFPDHHSFTRADLKKISRMYHGLEGRRKLIITTEKDSVRLLHNPYYPHSLKRYTYYLPIKISLHPGLDGDILEEEIDKAIRNRHLTQMAT